MRKKSLLLYQGSLHTLFDLVTQPFFMVAIFFAQDPVNLLAAVGLVFLSLVMVRRASPQGLFRRWWVLGFYGVSGSRCARRSATSTTFHRRVPGFC